MNKANLKYLVPNGITFLSLVLGIGATLAAAEEHLTFSAALVFISYWLDMLDGMAARKLDARSEFGLQLDSLVDMVTFGVTPAVLLFQYLRIGGASLVWVTPLAIAYALAGAFRLARFNLLPPKAAGDKDSVGLAITQASGTLVLALLADLVEPKKLFPHWGYLPLVVALAVLMVSTIRFPPITWFFLSARKGLLLLIFLFTLILILPTYSTWFWIYVVYLAISLGRMLYRRVSVSVPA
jgi:CDP-diacylglycerol---serine O-phosphatidyltransferase